SPSVRALGIRKGIGLFFDFGLEIWFAPELGILKRKFSSENSESEKKHSALESESET
ncbi:hypothetical protein C1645_824362, partial [Glomus cerebriforme]